MAGQNQRVSAFSELFAGGDSDNAETEEQQTENTPAESEVNSAEGPQDKIENEGSTRTEGKRGKGRQRNAGGRTRGSGNRVSGAASGVQPRKAAIPTQMGRRQEYLLRKLGSDLSRSALALRSALDKVSEREGEWAYEVESARAEAEAVGLPAEAVEQLVVVAAMQARVDVPDATYDEQDEG